MTILYGVIVCLFVCLYLWHYAKNTKYAELMSLELTGPKHLSGSVQWTTAQSTIESTIEKERVLTSRGSVCSIIYWTRLSSCDPPPPSSFPPMFCWSTVNRDVYTLIEPVARLRDSPRWQNFTRLLGCISHWKNNDVSHDPMVFVCVCFSCLIVKRCHF